MGKKFSIRKHKLRGRAKRRRHALKTNPKTFGIQKTLEKKNLEIIRGLEEKLSKL